MVLRTIGYWFETEINLLEVAQHTKGEIENSMEGICVEVQEADPSPGVYSIRIVLLGRVWTLTQVAEADFEGVHRSASTCVVLGSYVANDPAHHTSMLRQVFSQAFATAVPNPALTASVQEFLNTKSGADGLSSALLMAQVTYLQQALLQQASQFSSLNSRLVELENERSARDAGGKSSAGDAAGSGGGASAQQQNPTSPGSPQQTGTPSGSPSLKSRSKEPGPPLPTPDDFFRGTAEHPLDYPVTHSFASSSLLPASTIPTNNTVTAADLALESIMVKFLPQEPQRRYRSSAVAHIGRYVRRSMRGNVFEAGLHAISAFLPDDKLVVYVLVRKCLQATWQDQIHLRLQKLALQGVAGSLVGNNQPGQRLSGGSRGGGYGPSIANYSSATSQSDRTADDEDEDEDDDDDDDDDEDEEASEIVAEHAISKLDVVAGKDARVSYKLDVVNEVELISRTGRCDLCLLGLLEELSSLVGKDDLFKRSLCLVRAWWSYETPHYSHQQQQQQQQQGQGQATAEKTTALLTDATIAVMLAAVFNRHHDRIHFPLQALSVFLAEYGEVDWANSAITLQGVVPFAQVDSSSTACDELALDASCAQGGDVAASSSSSSSESSAVKELPCMSCPQPSHLASSDLLLRYWDVYNLTGPYGQGSRKKKGPEEGAAEEAGGGTLSAAALSSSSASATGKANSGSTSAPPSESDRGDAGSTGPHQSETASIGTVSTVGGVLRRARLESMVSLRQAGDVKQHALTPSAALEHFCKRAINVVHPLCYTNMAGESVTEERAASLAVIFKEGASRLGVVLQGLASASATTSAPEAEAEAAVAEASQKLQTFLDHTVARWSAGVRPDVLGGRLYSLSFHVLGTGASDSNPASASASSASSSSSSSGPGPGPGPGGLRSGAGGARPTHRITAEDLWEHVLYANLVAEQRISQSALLRAFKTILRERGTLPVGEIGKTLQDLASMQVISGKLKEAFGGLKKFLGSSFSSTPLSPSLFLSP